MPLSFPLLIINVSKFSNTRSKYLLMSFLKSEIVAVSMLVRFDVQKLSNPIISTMPIQQQDPKIVFGNQLSDHFLLLCLHRLKASPSYRARRNDIFL
jgi:hypothetical protein